MGIPTVTPKPAVAEKVLDQHTQKRKRHRLPEEPIEESRKPAGEGQSPNGILTSRPRRLLLESLQIATPGGWSAHRGMDFFILPRRPTHLEREH